MDPHSFEDEFNLFFQIDRGKNSNSVARNWINSAPQTDATIFAFAFLSPSYFYFPLPLLGRSIYLKFVPIKKWHMDPCAIVHLENSLNKIDIFFFLKYVGQDGRKKVVILCGFWKCNVLKTKYIHLEHYKKTYFLFFAVTFMCAFCAHL